MPKRTQNDGPEFDPVLSAVGTATCESWIPPCASPSSFRTFVVPLNARYGACGGGAAPSTQRTRCAYAASITWLSGTRLNGGFVHS